MQSHTGGVVISTLWCIIKNDMQNCYIMQTQEGPRVCLIIRSFLKLIIINKNKLYFKVILFNSIILKLYYLTVT